jgi:phage-related minor tail protein
MYGNKTGLMGEAGPEAIMPLRRGKGGKLGVEVNGTAGGDVIINHTFNFTANGDDSVKRIIAQSMPDITEATKASVLDARKRGGQFRRVFS